MTGLFDLVIEAFVAFMIGLTLLPVSWAFLNLATAAALAAVVLACVFLAVRS